MKICTTCNEPKEENTNNFRKSKLGKNGLRSQCRPCERTVENERRRNSLEHKEKEKKWNKTEKGKLKAKRGRIKFTFGISLEEYESYFEVANNKCQICDSEENLVLDHCHITLKIRGVLCSKCNVALGMLKDSIEILDKAKNYLREK